MKKKTIIVISLLTLTSIIVALSSIKVCACSPHAKLMSIKANICYLNTGLDEFKMHTGFYPNKTNGLLHLVEDFGMENWGGPYINKLKLPNDGYGHDFHYDLVNGIPIVISAGKDGKLGTIDDIETSRRMTVKKSEPVN